MDVNAVNVAQQTAELLQTVMQAQLQGNAMAEKLMKVAVQESVAGVGENVDAVR